MIGRLWRLAGLLAASGALVTPAVAMAADTFYASPSLADGSSSGGTCMTQSQPCSLREAVDDADSDSNLPVVVKLAPGTYSLTEGRIVDDGGFAGATPPAFDHVIEGSGAHASDTVITAGGHSQVFQYGDSGGGSNGNDELKDLEITGGSAPTGGGVIAYEVGIQNDGLTLDDVLVTGNAASSDGGGIYSDGYLTVEDSTISDNTVTGNGAGIYNDGSGLNGGGVLTVVNSTLAANTASGVGGEGGGIYTAGPGAESPVGNGVATVTNATIVSNSAPTDGGGGVYGQGGQPIVLTNTILANNTGSDCNGTVKPTDGRGNVADDASCAFSDSAQNTNPLLVQSSGAPSLADNGGPTETIALATGSPAIGAGVTAACPATDQRGIARPTNASCDSGAYQAQTPTNTVAPYVSIDQSGYALSGDPAAGGTLYLTKGTWSNAQSFTYQWQVCDPAGGNCSDISGATDDYYTIPTDQVGLTLRGEVTAINGGVSSTLATAATETVVAAMKCGQGAVTQTAANVSAYHAQLFGTVAPPTTNTYTVTFDYGPTTAYGFTTGSQSQHLYGGSFGTCEQVEWTAFTSPSTSYHYRVRMTSSDGTVTYAGSDETFTTPAATVRSGCTDGYRLTSSVAFSYGLCSAPDLDQVRLGELPNDGEMFCVPTATMDAMAYLAATLPSTIAPGDEDWTAPANFQTMSNDIGEMGTLMSSSGTGGTNGAGLLAGLTSWLSTAGAAAAGITYDDVTAGTDPDQGVTLAGIEQAVRNGGIVLMTIGTYNAQGQRVGGHEVFLTGLTGKDNGTEATVDISDPYTPALDDDVQPAYTADQLVLEMGSAGPDAPQKSLPLLVGYNYEWPGDTDAIDGYTALYPPVIMSAGPGDLVFTPTEKFFPGAPGQQTVTVPAPPVSVAFAPGGEIDYLTGGSPGAAHDARAARAARAPRAAAADTDALVGFDRATRRSEVLIRGLRSPRELVIGGPAQLRYILDERGVSAFTAAGKLVRRLAVRDPAQAAIAWDAAGDELGIASPGSRKLVLTNSQLRVVSTRALPLAVTKGNVGLDLAFAPSGSAVLHRHGSTTFIVIGLAAIHHAADGTGGGAHKLHVTGAVTGFTVDSSGRVLITVGGKVHAYTLAGVPIHISLPAGLPSATSLAVQTNIDPLAPGQPGQTLDELMPSLAQSTYKDGLTPAG